VVLLAQTVEQVQVRMAPQEQGQPPTLEQTGLALQEQPQKMLQQWVQLAVQDWGQVPQPQDWGQAVRCQAMRYRVQATEYRVWAAQYQAQLAVREQVQAQAAVREWAPQEPQAQPKEAPAELAERLAPQKPRQRRQ